MIRFDTMLAERLEDAALLGHDRINIAPIRKRWSKSIPYHYVSSMSSSLLIVNFTSHLQFTVKIPPPTGAGSQLSVQSSSVPYPLVESILGMVRRWAHLYKPV